MTSDFLAGRSLLAAWLLLSLCGWAASADSSCADFESGVSAGRVSFSALTEASGIAASRRNYGVLWTHNDGSDGKIYALTTNAVRLATFSLTQRMEDVEDIAVGPGPTNGISYLYVGDIGGSARSGDVRRDVKLFRIPEPVVELEWASNARSLTFDDVSTFTLVYPDASYNSETLMVDPLTADLWIATKEPGPTRLYRTNVNSATNRQTI